MFKVLHIGQNSSIPTIFELFADKLILMHNFQKEKLFKEQEHIEQIDSRADSDKFFGLFKKAKEIKKISKEANIDVVFINKKRDMLAAKIAFLFKRKRPIILGTFHNPITWQNDKKIKMFIPIMKFCLDGHLSMASFAYNKLIKFKFPRERLLFFPNYIKFEDFKQKNEYTIKSKFRICYSGIIDKRKNELFSIQVINSLKEKTNVVFDIYGPVLDQSYNDDIQNYISKNNLSEIVKIHPRLSPVNERQMLIEHDLYFSSSLAEMCPLNILNAKACALPILLSDTIGQQDLIDDGIDGIKFSENDIQDASKKLDTLINDIKLRSFIGKNAFVSVSDKHSYKKAAKQLEDFISKIIEIRG